eukprot:TRINITY_DN64437_c0_g1_i1.p1 TRINITY_DN64437_c0_g1~~TRINITY_DN64437_c0_g1_i1.p1  ORF type:complete len:443 (+),score=127.26 TRINITY_DN64437_c0_g1_i1:77-1405(+)
MAKQGSATAAAAAAAAASRSKKKGKKTNIGYIVAIGGCVGVTLLAVFLALTGDEGGAKPRGLSALDSLVNDDSVIKAVNREGTFTAAPQDFFKGWTLGDLKYGFDGTTLSPLLGMAGAVQYCEESDESFESGIVPINFDGREKWPGCIGDVYDSGNCTASYAIAAASSLSARYCVADSEKYKQTRLSPQQVLSCDKKSLGCQGGGIDSVFAYMQRRGLYPEECLPFKGKAGSECKTTCEESRKLKPLSHCVLRGGVKAIKKEILAHGPVVVPMRLTQEFLVYSGGIYTPSPQLSSPVFGRDGDAILHAVTIVGWGKAEGTPYWLVQNSFGTSWGEQGYARVAVTSTLMEESVVVAVPETEENVAKAEAERAKAEERREKAKKERAEREERIAAQRAAREAQKEQEELDSLDDFEDDADLDLDLDDEDGAKDASAEAKDDADM